MTEDVFHVRDNALESWILQPLEFIALLDRWRKSLTRTNIVGVKVVLLALWNLLVGFGWFSTGKARAAQLLSFGGRLRLPVLSKFYGDCVRT
jgi:hypothetical protein